MMSSYEIYLSPPDVGTEERRLLLDAFDSGWVAPVGPHLDAFERECAELAGVSHAVALSSGTAALHLALIALDVPRDAAVLTSTLTFAATANAITYVGAEPVFVDVSPDTWTIDPDLLEEAIAALRASGTRIGAVITVDLYGQCADYRRIESICRRHAIPLVCDAAEAVGATYEGRPAGSFGDCGVFSFNGNKIITTSGGGMLLSSRRDLIAWARHLSTQARDPAPHYQHSHVGFNYRMSNLLAAVGRGQLQSLAAKIGRRRDIRARYRAALASMPGLSFMPEAPYGESNAWLTCITVDAEAFGASREQLRQALESARIESRPLWKPMHQQPVFAAARMFSGAVADDLFACGLCLPSGSGMSSSAQERVIGIIAAARCSGLAANGRA